MIPFDAQPNPMAQTLFGLAAIGSEVDAEYYISGLALITFGFLVSEGWALCADDESTTWTAISDESTTWSDCT